MVFLIDINGLKVINDTIGHAAGDELICGAADCIEASDIPWDRLISLFTPCF